jgi:hypothetical protein
LTAFFNHQVTKIIIVASSLWLDKIRPKAELYIRQSKLGVFVSSAFVRLQRDKWWLKTVSSAAPWARHLVETGIHQTSSPVGTAYFDDVPADAGQMGGAVPKSRFSEAEG